MDLTKRPWPICFVKLLRNQPLQVNNVFLVNALSLMYGKSNTKPVVCLVVKVRNDLYILQNNWIIQLLHYPDPLGPADKERLADRFKAFLISHYILSNDPFVIYKFYFPEYYMSYKNIILSFQPILIFQEFKRLLSSVSVRKIKLSSPIVCAALTRNRPPKTKLATVEHVHRLTHGKQETHLVVLPAVLVRPLLHYSLSCIYLKLCFHQIAFILFS